MARGNDASQAQAELQKTLGMAGNAEALIEYNKAMRSPEVRAASNKAINGVATESLELGDLSSHVDGEILAYAVRGKSVIVVFEDAGLRTHKVAIPLDDLGRAGRRAERATAAAEADPDVATTQATDGQGTQVEPRDDSASRDDARDAGRDDARAARGDSRASRAARS